MTPGLRVSSLCRGGLLTAVDPSEQRKALADNKAAIAEAAILGTDALIMVMGGLPAGDRDIVGARHRVADRMPTSCLTPRSTACANT